MKIIYKQGDLLSCEERWILHGCNAQGVMGSGVARDIRTHYPSAYEVYLAQHSKGWQKLGTVTFAMQNCQRFVFNGITQEFYGRDGKQYVDYKAVEDVIWCMNKHAQASDDYLEGKTLRVAMPKIGAGLGGGDWDVISKIIEEESTNFQPVVYTL